MSPELPNFDRGNNPGNRSNSDSEDQNQIVWVDSEDVYKPIPKKLSEFTAARGIQEAPVTPVYVKAEALDSLKAHLASNLRVEQGGILFGNAYEDPFLGIYVEIIAAVAAPATIGTGAHLEFTPDSWLGIMDYARSEHPDENIVGWYHSHPNMAVFMSGTDMRTQQSFFYHPWCLSIVHDPVSEAIGYFLGESAKRVKPVIFGGVNRGYSTEPMIEPRGNQENVQQIENASIQTEGSLAAISRQHNNRSRRSRKFLYFRLFLLFLVSLLALFLIVLKPELLNSIISQSTSNPSPTANQPPLPFKASLESMPAMVFRYLENDKIDKLFLRFPVIEKAGKEIGRGEEVTLLVISKEGTEETENINLEVKQLTPKEVGEIDNKKVIDFLKAKIASFEKRSDLGDLKSLSLPLKIGELGVMIPLFSFKVSNSEISGSPDKAPKSTIKTDDVIYFPIKLTYQDARQQEKEVALKDILK
ncbi:Mov34/MPN/PAD-1 family protein [Ancylothrix sp. C2]|uniref:Mov34/MPN/PAD-1 family protein n=1 Tax=Ancylothrix sp. D3o TaxID=2953691 RepID=UPI0021BAEA5B|nr:Mov34/MPN/PAD-1 family protein [Ancylothrix sp. D3o]MCT7952762.1 Mov34/MPN/PAD-1 family protein [Ancylothrix sp. D3o]